MTDDGAWGAIFLRLLVFCSAITRGLLQAQAPAPSALPPAVSDTEVCAQSYPGQQGYPMGRTAQITGKLGLNTFAANFGNPNPCLVQCRTASGNVWTAAKPWGTPCILHGEQRFCAANACVLKNDSYIDYCRQNFQTSNAVIALTPYMCTLECIDITTGIVLKVKMTDGTACQANTGRGYEPGFCYSGACTVAIVPYVRRLFPGYNRLGLLFG
ncbi:uncharacterized protein LOC119174083 isoform X1 [Rhipicephalus microplus]|uniref:uncharacterized protein LOC119174083 isoform X1 n=1 Tax=Rhipicephalus microplus TaxID=6941 RepID=UPI003F6D784B